MKKLLLALAAIALASPAFATIQEPCSVTTINPKSSNPKADKNVRIVPRHVAEEMQKKMVLKDGEAVVISCPAKK